MAIRLKDYRMDIHSQYGEDGIIAKILDEVGLPVNLHGYWCMDIGAWDGVKFSNIHALVERGAAAVEVEADPERFAMLTQTAENPECNILPWLYPVGFDNVSRIVADAVVEMDGEHPLVLSIDIDGDHAGLLRRCDVIPFRIVVAEWNNRGDVRQYDPLRAWAADTGYKCVAKTNANLVFVVDSWAADFEEVISP